MKNPPRDALLSIGTESMPARFVPLLLKQLEDQAAALLKEARLPFESIKVWGSPRRLAVYVAGLGAESESLKETKIGPPASALKDGDGAFTVVAAGFARTHGVEPSKLAVVTTPKGERLAVEKTIPGEPAGKILARLWPKLLGSLQFPKSMEWEAGRFRFGRPIRDLLALYGKTVVPFEIAGVKSGRKTLGLMATGAKPLQIAAPAAYVAALKNACVLVDPADRRAVLRKGLEELAAKEGRVLDADPDLMEELVFLTEHPVPVPGSFPEAFLKLPEELVTTVLKKQIKFFPLRDRSGRLLHRFIGVRDGLSEGQREVQEGYERVVIARLDDAVFYVEKDLKRPLAEMRERLKGVQFHPRLGTLHDKSVRIAELAAWLCEAIRQEVPVDEAVVREIAELGYADLGSEVIREFPELQGRIGGEYARRQGLSERVALGLSEFYFPLAARSALPATLEGCLASLAAKIDTLAGDFAVGLIPSGSEDPHGLRRQALGAVRILVERQLPISLAAALRKSLLLLPLGLDEGARESVALKLEDFLVQRLEGSLEEAGFRFDEVRAVRDGALENLPRTVRRVTALHGLRGQPEFDSLAAAFKRASNILKGSAADGAEQTDPALFVEDAERGLFEGLRKVQGEIQLRLQDGEFEESLRLMVQLKPSVDKFFEEVMVLAEDPRLRGNRLSIVNRLVRLFKSVADLSQLQ